MKKKIILGLPIILATIFICCTDSLEDASPIVDLEHFNLINKPHFVTLQDVQNLTKAIASTTRRANSQTQDIICYEDDEHDTLLYICDKENGGWIIYASDTRVPAIVAQSETGSFAHASENEALMAWVATIAEDMKIIKHASDVELNFTPSEIESNRKFWKSIRFPDEFAKEIVNESQTRKELPPLTPGLYEYGHYELLTVENYTEKYDSISRLTQTNWHQEDPYNMYCPLKSDNSGNRAPAGCVAVAGAQMLYFLHYKLGVPTIAPSKASCTGNINGYYMTQTDPTTTIWDSMNIDNGRYAAPLVANVSNLVNTQYGNDGSFALLSNIVGAFYLYGISCEYGDYNTANLCSNLNLHMPVILNAQSQNSNIGHAFIADRYLRMREITKRTYVWVYDSIPQNFPVPEFLPNQITYTYSSPFIAMIGMNWGKGIDYYDSSEWFTLTGNWVLDNVSYNQSRKMICNFSIAH
jgi:hypothetical protein